MQASDIATLDRTFRIDGQVRVVDRDGAAVVVASVAECDAEIAVQGAQVLSWRPAGQVDVLWCSPTSPLGTGKAVRGGIPICWPWFGPHATDPTLPQHGIARTAQWVLEATYSIPGGVAVEFSLEAHGCALKLVATCGARLSVALTTRNAGTEPVFIGEALHTYFRVGDVSRATVEGLDGLRYRDNTDGGRDKQQSGACTLQAETIALFDTAPDQAALTDPVLGRRITIAREGGRSTVVWHPGATAGSMKDIPPGGEAHFVCVESGNIGASRVVIGPGTQHRLTATYSVESL